MIKLVLKQDVNVEGRIKAEEPNASRLEAIRSGVKGGRDRFHDLKVEK